MMKLIFSLTVIWALFSTAGALQCTTCVNAAGTSCISRTCSSTETACVTAAFQFNSSGTVTQQVLKTCATSSLCPATGSQTYSVNLGSVSTVASVQCCNTDNCNSQTLPFPNAGESNSLQCFTCNPLTGQCDTRLQCNGVEDRCFKANVTSGNNTISARGCASANICTAAASVGSLPFLQSTGNISSALTCCGTSLCNASDTLSIRLDVIHLLLGLLIYTLY